MEKLRADALVESHGLGYHVNVCPQGLTKIGHLVHKANLHSEKAIRGVLDQLGRLDAGDHERCLDEIKGTVKILEDSNGVRAVCPNDDPVRSQEVFDRRALAQKFRIGGDIENSL